MKEKRRKKDKEEKRETKFQRKKYRYMKYKDKISSEFTQR